ncbi:ABC transporter ATP-binding protein [Thermococcus sp. M39]|uniref:ABC transporter ATP-binding protein n=1 Tax=unclassified Thermococcus TaxID=2627626 RepID=UPI0014397953|nr:MULTISPECIES: ABC transporter ATP-binding protein [unclassified Thermococcus]NJE08765.1 ABC transporter ATP-binding protein [Thermococcus sp. M39]NJE12933.1 ABC transporter ATP-binding protein [Thermococcus sp. LS2]
MLEVKITFSYGRREVLKDVEFSTQKERLLTVIGPNGAGKSTLLKCMVGILNPRGYVKLDNVNLLELKPKDRAKFITYVPQSSVPEFAFTIEEFVEMGAYATKGDVRDALEKIGMWERRKEFVTNLSGGEYQLVLIARALAQGSEVILLDEPTSHLDINHALLIMDLLEELKREKIVVAVMHDLNLALQYSDEIILLNEGKVEWKGNVKELNPEILEKVYRVKAKIIEIEGKPVVLAEV